MSKIFQSTQSSFYCTQCGSKGFDIQRKKSKQKEAGHLKKLYCLRCRCQNNFVEIKEHSDKYTYEDFLVEFNNNNFNKEGERVLTYPQLLLKLREENDENE